MSDASGTTPDGPSSVLLLGVGDAGPELALAFERFGALVVSVRECADADAVAGLLDEHRPDYVVAVSADVSPAVLAAAERASVEVFPTSRASRLWMDREGLRKLAGDELGLPTVPFWFASSPEELAAVADHAGFPLVVTPLTGTVAEGQSVLTRPGDVEPAWQRAFPPGPAWANRVMAETVVEVDDEITLLVVRTAESSGPAVHFCEPIGHRRGMTSAGRSGATGGMVSAGRSGATGGMVSAGRSGATGGMVSAGRSGATGGMTSAGRSDAGIAPLETWQPQPLSLAALDAARSIAARVVQSLGGRGVFAVDLLVHGDEVYFATVRAQPCDVGMVTLRSQRLSQYELHARAILGLAVDTIMISPAAAEVGSRRTVSRAALIEALTVPEGDVRLLAGTSVAIATAPDVVRARDRAHRISTVVHGLGL